MPSGMWSTDRLAQCMDLDCSILLSAKTSGDTLTYLFVRANIHVYITRLKMRTYVSTNEVSTYCDLVTTDESSADTIYSQATSSALQCWQTILWSTSYSRDNLGVTRPRRSSPQSLLRMLGPLCVVQSQEGYLEQPIVSVCHKDTSV